MALALVVALVLVASAGGVVLAGLTGLEVVPGSAAGEKGKSPYVGVSIERIKFCLSGSKNPIATQVIELTPAVPWPSLLASELSPPLLVL